MALIILVSPSSQCSSVRDEHRHLLPAVARLSGGYSVPVMDPAPMSVDLPSSVTVSQSASGLSLLRVSTPVAQGEVYLHGAQVTGWVPAGQQPVLWLSSASTFSRDSAIRGGVPICFPWFGPGRGGRMSPAHGFARLAEWPLVSAVDLDGVVTLTFRLTEAEVSGVAGAATWSHPFELTYVVMFGTELNLALTVRNSGDREFSYEEALHAYFAVQGVEQVAVDGLAGDRYLDKTGRSGDDHPVQHGQVRVRGETDSVYTSAEAATITDARGGRRIRIAKYGSSNTVVWNPGAAKAAGMSDFGEGEWSSMLSVEAANALDFAISLRPGAAHTIAARYSVSPIS
jgi:glucose-6-phosphate 1-epimerase